MASIVVELLDKREISKYLIGIADVEAEWGLRYIAIKKDEWIRTGDNGIRINEGQSERCLVKYELWDKPPPPLDCWDRTWSGSVRLTSGLVFALNDCHPGEAYYGAEFNLGQRDTVWQVRIHRKALGYEEFTPDLISFTLLKLQFWLAPPWTCDAETPHQTHHDQGPHRCRRPARRRDPRDRGHRPLRRPRRRH
ncbi:hypothetical protein GBF35_11640 [Nonomuraea phyllanthi]|uniref:hypothetical protein n=1 Tax=Nonomuraea phyllanthi TaxID=2219224 RepID=UPI0012935B4B|nr:hypothetical protein [Nonomuraea phyllanthi]QFY07254.1 hypothetical protein GBF35_11640 [Nonomuraea phyllanthi]